MLPEKNGEQREEGVQAKLLKVRYIAVTEKEIAASLLLPDDSPLKEAIFRALKIEKRAGKSWLDSWLEAMAEENQVNVEEIKEFVRHELPLNIELARFVFVIA